MRNESSANASGTCYNLNLSITQPHKTRVTMTSWRALIQAAALVQMDWWKRSRWLQVGTLLALQADDTVRFAEVVRRNVKQLSEDRGTIGISFCEAQDLHAVLLELTRRQASNTAQLAAQADAQRKQSTNAGKAGRRAAKAAGSKSGLRLMFDVLQDAGKVQSQREERANAAERRAAEAAEPLAATAAAAATHAEADATAASATRDAAAPGSAPAAASQPAAPAAIAEASGPAQARTADQAAQVAQQPAADPDNAAAAAAAGAVATAAARQTYDAVQVSCDFFIAAPSLHRLQEITEPAFAEELYLAQPRPLLAPPDWQSHAAAAGFIRDELDQFDAAQRTAFDHALSHRVALVQGPPGTGKTKIGVAIARALLTAVHGGGQAQPLLVLCQTNHALDQFLEALLASGVPIDDVLRVGGRSRSAQLEPANLFKCARLRCSDL